MQKPSFGALFFRFFQKVRTNGPPDTLPGLFNVHSAYPKGKNHGFGEHTHTQTDNQFEHLRTQRALRAIMYQCKNVPLKKYVGHFLTRALLGIR